MSLPVLKPTQYTNYQAETSNFHDIFINMIPRSLLALFAVLALGAFASATLTPASALTDAQSTVREEQDLAIVERDFMCKCRNKFKLCLNDCLQKCNRFPCATRCIGGALAAIAPPCYLLNCVALELPPRVLKAQDWVSA